VEKSKNLNDLKQFRIPPRESNDSPPNAWTRDNHLITNDQRIESGLPATVPDRPDGVIPLEFQVR